MTFKGIDLIPIITVIISIIGGLLTKAQLSIAKSNTTANAWTRLGAIAFSMAQDLWTALSAAYQQDMVDGKLDKSLYEKIVAEKLDKYTSADELAKIATAIGLPVPGIISWIAATIIDRITAAHDPNVTSVSALQFPVTANTVAKTEPEDAATYSQGG